MAKKTPSRSKPGKASSAKRDSTGASDPVLPASQQQQESEGAEAPTPPVSKIAKAASSTASVEHAVPPASTAALTEAKSDATLPPPQRDSDDDDDHASGPASPDEKKEEPQTSSQSSSSSDTPDASDDGNTDQVPAAPAAGAAALVAPSTVDAVVEPRLPSARVAWTIDDVIGAAAAVLGTDEPDAPGGDDFASSDDVTTVPLCFFGLHPLGLGNFTQPAGTEAAHPPPQNFAAAAHVVVLKCGHLACASCFATALAESSVSEEMDGGSRIALTANCPVCDAAATLTVSNATPQSDVAGRWVGAVQAITAHLPRLVDSADPSSRRPSALAKKASAHVTEAAAVASFISKLLSALERRVATASQADALGRSPDESASAAGGASITVCGICEEEAEAARCLECGFGLCDGCLTTVHSKGRFKRHTVTRIDVSSASQRAPAKRTRAADSAASSAASRAMCPEHSDYPVELCCYDCGVCICLRCHYNGSHKGHSTAPLADLHGSLSAAFRTNAEHLGRCATAVAKLSTEVATAIDAAESEAAIAKGMTAAAYADARRVLDEGQADATAQIDQWLQRRSGALSHDLAEARRTAGSLAMASVGIRSVLRDTSTQAIASLVRQRETITKRTGALAQSSVFVEEAISAVRDSIKKPGSVQKKEKPSAAGDKKGNGGATPPAPAPEEQLAIRAATLLRAQSAGVSLRFFTEAAVPKADSDNRAGAQLRQGVDVAVARLLAQSASDHAVHWAADPGVRLADRLRGASIAVAPSGPAMSHVEDANATGKPKKSVKIADGGKKRSTSPQASSASKSSRRTSAGLSIGSLLDLGSTRRAAVLDGDDDDAEDARRHSRGGARKGSAPYAANDDDDDNDDNEDDDNGAHEAEMMPRPEARATGRPEVTAPAEDFDFTTQEGGGRTGGARDGGRREETEKRLQVMASQWTDAPAPKAHRPEAGGGARSAPVAPPTAGSRGGALDFGPAGALRRARARPLAGNNGGSNGASAKPDGSGFNLRI